MNFNYNKKNKGFTLVELMISMLVFVLISGAIAGIFVSAIVSQRKILENQRVVNELSYIMEYISRDLRMAKKDEDQTCLSINANYQLFDGNSRIRFLSKENRCHEYFLRNNRVYEKKSEDEWYNFGVSDIPLTSSKVHIEDIHFDNGGSNWQIGSGNQPKVVINFEFRSVSEDELLILQTAVSQRNINI